jgi:adenine-specific DNA glycosylase
VEKFFPSFIKKYRQPEIVMKASDLELESDLRFLGLQRQRRVALKGIAEKIVSTYSGKTPIEYHSLMSLPHVGCYIANAVLCFSQSQRRPIVDTNVARVLTRFHGLAKPKDAREKWIWELAEKMLPKKNWEKYNYALIDLGALVCKSEEPRCYHCCIQSICMKGKERIMLK